MGDDDSALLLGCPHSTSGVPRVGKRGYLRDLAKKKKKSRDRERVQCFRLATCKLSWPEHRAPVLGELLVSGSGLMCQRRRDESVSQPSIVLLSHEAALSRPIVAGYFFYGGFSAALRVSRVAVVRGASALGPISCSWLLRHYAQQRCVSRGQIRLVVSAINSQPLTADTGRQRVNAAALLASRSLWLRDYLARYRY